MKRDITKIINIIYYIFTTYCKKVLVGILLVIIIILLIKEPIALCDISSLSVEEMKIILEQELKKLITSDKFKQQYGTSKHYPFMLTRYYFSVICHPDFVPSFLNELNLKQIMAQYDTTTMFLKEIERRFYLYTDQSLKQYENKIRFFISICTNTHFLINNLILKNTLFNYPYGNIITPRTARWNQEYNIWRKKQLIQCTIFALIVVLKFIVTSG